jgi:hypothetical protein
MIKKINEELRRKIVELANMIENLEYRSVIEHRQLMNYFEMDRRVSEYYRRVKMANAVLLTKGKFLRNVANVGYEVIHPDEFIDVAGSEFRKATRRMRQGDKIRTNAPLDKMSAEGLKRHRMVSDRMTTVSRFLNEQKRDVFQLMNASLPKHNRTFECLPERDFGDKPVSEQTAAE